MPRPATPKIYHIVHIDRLPSIIQDGFLWSDAVLQANVRPGTTIGMTRIKERRLNELRLPSHNDLYVGQCVPFYFCPRSIMLYLIHRQNPELLYQGGQGSIIHLQCDLEAAVAWASANGRRWAFTLSNAGAYYFEDRCDLGQLDDINWDAVQSNRWSGQGISTDVKEGKQAEFLVEHSFPWELVERIGAHSLAVARQAIAHTQNAAHRPIVEVKADWYY